jgi:signal transduction histidine kinase
MPSEPREPEPIDPQFLALAAHELRGAATVIVAAADTLPHVVRTEDIGPVGVELLESLGRNGRRLRKLVIDLLATSYLDHGDLPVEPQVVPVLPIIHWSTEDAMVDGQLGSIECDPLLHALVDPDRLEQILTNLLSNAVAHGRPPIDVTAVLDNRRGSVKITVRDHGEGVPAADALRIFDRFSPVAKRTSSSTGLGLSIARELARAMGGDVTHEAAEPGSAFVVDVPGP